jgi:hypothetical protein
MSDYPEHEKLKLVKDRSQAVGEFLDRHILGDNIIPSYPTTP